MAIEHLLRRLGSDLGVPLEFDGDGRCMLVCNDGLRVELALVAGRTALLFTSPLSDEALVPSLALYASALRYATNMEQGGGAAVTLDPSHGGFLRLQLMRPVERLYDDEFRATLSDFMAEARRARETFSQATQADHGEPRAQSGRSETYIPSEFDLRI